MNFTRLGPLYLLMVAALSSCLSAAPSAEDLQKIESLRAELVELDAEISDAEQKNARLAGGLVKALVEARIEILRTTHALVQQRIHALESGAKITFEVAGAKPDAELAERLSREMEDQLSKLEAARQEADRYSGGLVSAMKQATVATQEQTLAMLHQRLLAAKYGLPTALPSSTAKTSESQGSISSDNRSQPGGIAKTPAAAKEMINVRLLKKQFSKQDYQDYIFFDIEFTAIGLEKPARAIKGVLNLQDLFGEAKMKLNWTIDEPLSPNQKAVAQGTGFKYNQFIDEHHWVLTTDLEDMTASFTVKSILYADGSRRDL